MQYCINALLKNNNEIMQYCIINNDIALIMHYRALLQMPGCDCTRYLLTENQRINWRLEFDPNYSAKMQK